MLSFVTSPPDLPLATAARVLAYRPRSRRVTITKIEPELTLGLEHSPDFTEHFNHPLDIFTGRGL